MRFSLCIFYFLSEYCDEPGALLAAMNILIGLIELQPKE